MEQPLRGDTKEAVPVVSTVTLGVMWLEITVTTHEHRENVGATKVEGIRGVVHREVGGSVVGEVGDLVAVVMRGDVGGAPMAEGGKVAGPGVGDAPRKAKF